jgi:hypothetical protein
MTRIELSRLVQADPSSVALVLAGPAARELWPRSDRLIGVVAPQQPNFSVTLDPPARTGVGFTARAKVHSGDVVVGSCRLTILPTSDFEVAAPAGCEVRLSVEASDEIAERLRRDAARYLDNLAQLSRERSSAA